MCGVCVWCVCVCVCGHSGKIKGKKEVEAIHHFRWLVLKRLVKG